MLKQAIQYKYRTNPSSLDGLIRLYHWPSYPPELPMALPIPQPSLVTTPGCIGVRCLLGSVHSDHLLCQYAP